VKVVLISRIGISSSPSLTKDILITNKRLKCTKGCRFSVFENYLFKGLNGEHLLALGIASLFNHSSKPNLDYRVDKLNKVGIPIRVAEAEFPLPD